ncbi:TerB family tellurite resistance protein [Shewanella gelidii]|uniref:Tellurium resistance terB-like protein subgroup 2 n=1 Tax=Shewanella gelidii TaxID=1642821 RepID=A0A917JSW4_9GAMM|nr:TerB family tellurite resistance protein [Shewanella gelidii]MCL1098518.1 TerB family tellurite resistance protein [Shewanella gelidii]GGI82144.1 tellurium resistance terB-like protein subgroup 2 [Shewanella gelidii]
MIAKLKQLFLQDSKQQDPATLQYKLNLAAASLLVEVIYADEDFDQAEAAILPELLHQTLQIEQQEAASLIEAAKQARHDSTSLFEFTAEINDQFDLEQKKQLILAMWRVAYADGQLCQFEDQIIRRTADLFYLKHSEIMQMRNRAMKAS